MTTALGSVRIVTGTWEPERRTTVGSTVISVVAPPRSSWRARITACCLIAAVGVGFVGCASVGGSNAGLRRSSSTGFEAAKQAWEKGAAADSADQGVYWSRAGSDLTKATGAGESGGAGFKSAEHELEQLAVLPDADQTQAESAAFQHDIRALNTFFGTSGLYG